MLFQILYLLLIGCFLKHISIVYINNVINLSITGLTTDICLYIMDNYEKLMEEYGVRIDAS